MLAGALARVLTQGIVSNDSESWAEDRVDRHVT